MLSSRSLSWLLFALCSTASTVSAGQAVPARVYVNAAAPAGGDGHSWQTAYSSLDVALLRAPSGSHIWIAAGNYKPVFRTHPGDPRSATFHVARDLKLFGGFVGDEQSLGERAGLFRSTILDGDIGALNDDSDNVDHVVKVTGPASPLSAAIVLDGFTITNGNSRGSGGGIYDIPVPITPPGVVPVIWGAGNLLLRNCTVIKNKAAVQGGGLYSQLARIDVAWCTFAENTASSGGAIHPQACTLRVYNSRFLANRATARGGAVDANSIFYSPETGPAVWFVNSLFDSNRAPFGGAAYLAGSQHTGASAVWTNCTFTANEADSAGGAIAVRPSPSEINQPHVFVYNSILWGNSAPTGAELHRIEVPPGSPPFFADIQVDHSIVAGGYAGDNSSLDPLLVDRDGNLAPSSPAIDAGNNAYVLIDEIDLDQDGEFELLPLALGSKRPEERFQKHPHASPGLPGADPYGTGKVVDLGAHEFQPHVSSKP